MERWKDLRLLFSYFPLLRSQSQPHTVYLLNDADCTVSIGSVLFDCGNKGSV
jgi:hypothetical protein